MGVGAGLKDVIAQEGIFRQEVGMLFKMILDKINRRSFYLGGVALGLLGLAACSTTPATNGHTTLVASGHPDWPPVMFAKNGQIDGVGPALAKKIFADLNIKATFPEEGLWDQVLLKTRNGDVDMLVAAYKTTERLEYFTYADTYITDPLVLFVKKGKEFTFAKNEDLIGKTGVGTTGDSYGQEFDDYIKHKLGFEWVATSKEALDMVAAGKADYFIYSLYAGHEELMTEKRVDDFVELPQAVSQEPFYMVFSKKSAFVKYVPQINELMAKYKADGTLDKMIADYKKQSGLE